MVFLAFLVPRILRGRVEITEMIVTPFLVPSKIHRRGTRGAQREPQKAGRGTTEARVPGLPEQGCMDPDEREAGLGTLLGAEPEPFSQQGWREPQEHVAQPCLALGAAGPTGRFPAGNAPPNGAGFAPVRGDQAQRKFPAFGAWVSCCVWHDRIWDCNLGLLLENSSQEIQGVSGNSYTPEE